MRKILVVVDMQNDFIDGALGTHEAVSIVDNVCTKIREGEWDYIFTIQDTHDGDDYLETQEGKKLPILHCIDGTEGHRLHKNICSVIERTLCNTVALLKFGFGSESLVSELWNIILSEDLSLYAGYINLTIIGVCTDICVISNALLLKAHYPEMRITVDASCCAGSTPEKHKMALEVMKSCQIDIIN